MLKGMARSPILVGAPIGVACAAACYLMLGAKAGAASQLILCATVGLGIFAVVTLVLAGFGVVWSRSRLMRLAPGATVP